MKKKTVVGLLAGACLLASTFPLYSGRGRKRLRRRADGGHPITDSRADRDVFGMDPVSTRMQLKQAG